MKQTGICLLVLFLLSRNLYSQTFSEVKESDMYFYGEGYGSSLEEADNLALSALISQISMNIDVITDLQNDRKEHQGRVISDNNIFKAAIKTYSQATLQNTKRLVIADPPQAHVARWIKREDLDKIFGDRRKKIYEFIEAAERAESKGKVDMALKNYCWAFILVKSMQRANDETYEKHPLMSWLPEKIDDVLSDVKISLTKREGDDVVLHFTYKGLPVNSLDYYYMDGGFESAMCSARDGEGAMELSAGVSHDTYQIQIECEYRDQARLDPEVMSVMNVTPRVNYKQATVFVKGVQNSEISTSGDQLSNKKKSNDAVIGYKVNHSVSKSFTEVEDTFFQRPPSLRETSKYDGIMSQIVKAIQERRYDDVQDCFTTRGWDIYRKLIKYGQSKLINDPVFSYMNLDGSVICRGLRLSFQFRNGKRKFFVENIVFTFNEFDKIDNISFGLGQTTEDDILGQSAYPEIIRKLLVQFMENYQTAYALKRKDYIEQIFDEDAIIIVGNKLNKAPNIHIPHVEGMKHIQGIEEDQYSYKTYTKEDYMKKLTASFASKEFINIRFNNCEVQKSAKGGELYGIQIEQDYYSSNYCDHGYLFLEINLNDLKKPLILIRTWQPELDPNFGLYGLDNFPLSTAYETQ